MPWNSTWPVGTSSVKSNRTTGNQNTTYIKTIVDTDHYFDSGDVNSDGYHRKVGMVNQDPAPSIPGAPSNVASLIYAAQKTSGESPDNQDSQAFFRNADQIMQLLGIRACGVFTCNAGVGTPTVTMNYSHNLDSDTITANSVGNFTVLFDTALPSANYGVLFGAVPFVFSIPFGTTTTADDHIFMGVRGDSGNIVATAKGTGGFDFNTYSRQAGQLINPLQGWFVVFGG